MTERCDTPPSEALKLAEEWKGRADDAGRLSRAILSVAQSESAALDLLHSDGFYLGVCISLCVIYSMDRDPTAVLPVELVSTVAEDELLAFARKNAEYELPLIR